LEHGVNIVEKLLPVRNNSVADNAGLS